MECKIILLSYMKYNKKDDNSPMTRLEFAFVDVQDTDKFKGISIISSYYKGHGVFDKLDKSLILKPVSAEFEVFQDYYNPLSERKVLKSINGISLL